MSSETPSELLSQLRDQADKVRPEDAVQIAKALAAKDGLFFCKFVLTRDESDPNLSAKPFPLQYDYLVQLWRAIDTSQRNILAKSRQMLASWFVATYATHWARSRPNQAVYWQTKAWEDAVGMVSMPEGGFMGRCQFIEAHLPGWLQTPHKASEGRIQYTNGSIIQALAGGADKIRSKVASLIIEDEFAFQDDQEGVYTAVNPLVQKGAKLIIISTPNGSDNTFATLYHGHKVGASEAMAATA